jgi:hypothetical protein
MARMFVGVTFCRAGDGFPAFYNQVIVRNKVFVCIPGTIDWLKMREPRLIHQ